MNTSSTRHGRDKRVPPASPRPAPADARNHAPPSVRRGVAVVALFYFLLLLLNGPAMSRSAEKLEFGRGRDIAMRLTKPLASLARICRYDSIRRIAEKIELAYLE